MNEDSVIMEVKNGPYYGMEIDRKRIQIDDNSSTANFDESESQDIAKYFESDGC